MADENKLGEGGFAKVFLGDKTRSLARVPWPNTWPDRVAVKVDKDREQETAEATEKRKKSLINTAEAEAEEMRVLSKYQHQYMNGLLGWSIDGPSRALVFEHCPGGSVKDRMRGSVIDAGTGEAFPPLTWEHRLKIIAQICGALEYLHEGAVPPVFHRDVKPDK
jgi:serine/threonine protein kinase